MNLSDKYSKRIISDGVYITFNGAYKFIFGCNNIDLVAFDKENKWDKKKSSKYCLHRWRTDAGHFSRANVSSEIELKSRNRNISVCCMDGVDDI